MQTRVGATQFFTVGAGGAAHAAGTILKRSRGAAPLVLALAAGGCWSGPNALVQPPGEPRLIESGIQVHSTIDRARIETVDEPMRTVTLRPPGESASRSYRVAPSVKLDSLRVGDLVHASLTEDLAVYVPRDGHIPRQDGSASPQLPDARILTVDRSYRLLTVRFADGRKDTFKVGLGVKVDDMQPGDAILIRPVEIDRLSVRGQE